MIRLEKSFIKLALTMVSAALLLTACASKTDVDIIQQQAQKDREETRELYRQLEQEIETRNTPVREKQADIWAEVNGLRSDIAMLQGKMDDIDMRMNFLMGENNSSSSLLEVARDVEAIKFVMKHQLAVDLEEVMTKMPVPTMQTPTTLGAQTPTTGPTDAGTALYDKAYDAFGRGSYEEARQLWAEFVTTFKDHQLVANAIFWQGECYYQLSDYQRAILTYQDVIQKYPDSPKFKYSLLKQGISWYNLGKKDAGKERLNKLISNYPASVEAKRAKQFLEDNG